MSSRPVTVILGSQWGDEGKGKIVDLLALKADIVCRFNGGNNAGHTIVVDGVEYDFHSLPSGIINEKCISVIGNGCIVHLPDLMNEIAKNEAKGLKNWQQRLYISDRAHLVFDLHQEIDGLTESGRGKENLGTTKKGIGPTYSSKATRNGVRFCDLMGDFQIFEQKFRALYNYAKQTFQNLTVLNVDKELERYKELREKVRPCVRDVTYFMNQQVRSSTTKFIIAEGANAAMLDIDFGTYPYVTSSSTTIGGVCNGLGVPPHFIGDVIGIVKAYTTRVGVGAFATELNDATGEYLQTVGKEFGVTTGRKRRCGWLDLVVVQYSHMINNYTHLALTKLDILSSLKELKVAVGYKLNGLLLDSFPASIDTLEGIEVVYETFEGWDQSLSEFRKFEELPANARKYVEFIENFLKVPVKYIGVGKGREAIIIRD